MKYAKTLDDFAKFEVVSLDFETESLTDKRAVLFSMAAVTGDWRDDDAILSGVFKRDQLPNLLKFLPGKRIVFHNFKFDGMVLLTEGADIFSFQADDTALMAMLLAEDQPVGLKVRASTDLGMPMQDWDAEVVKRFKADDEKGYIEYSRLDAIATIRLFHGYKEQIIKQDLVGAYKIEVKAAYPILFMEYNGIEFDPVKCDELELHADTMKLAYEDLIFKKAGYVFGLTKPKELGGYLYDELGIEYKKVYSRKMKTASRSTAKDVLEEIKFDLVASGKDDLADIVENILGWKRMTKLLSAFFNQQREAAKTYGDGRVHPDYSQTRIVSGRIASSNPNLMQLPYAPIIEGNPESNLRKMYVAGKGKKFIDADYGQIELRMMAHMSGDPSMIRAFQNNEDFHQMTADKTGIERQKAKIANFGKQYGMSPYSFARVTKMDVEHAKAFYREYDKAFPKTVLLGKDIVASVLDKGYIRMIGGRKRRLPEDMKEDVIERNFVSALIQGSSATVLKLAMINIFDQFKNRDVKLVLTVHDELLFECPEDMAVEAAQTIKDGMETAIELKVPLVAEPAIGNSYGDFK